MLVFRLSASRGRLPGPLRRTFICRRCYHATQTLRKAADADQSSEQQQNPLASQLTKTFEGLFSGRDKRKAVVYLRPQIANPGLCDDVLSYIGPSLEKHKGCDILDLYPGAGLWSSKLHEFLKPRNHILLEPEPDLFGPYLQPLIDQPGSTYKLVVGDPIAYSTYDKLIDDGYFPEQRRVDPADPQAQELNNTLLVTGTLLWNPPLPAMGLNSVGKQLHGAFSRFAWRNEVFHAMGPARMLFWMRSDDAKRAVPHEVQSVGKNTPIFAKTADVVEVVGPGHPDPRNWSRAARYEIESLVRAMKRAKENGMELPAHRRENIHDFADDIAKMTDGTGIIGSSDLLKYLKAQEESGKSTEGVTTGQFRQHWLREKAFLESPVALTAREKGAMGRPRVPVEQRRLGKSRASVVRHASLKAKIDRAVDIGERIHQQECLLLSTPEGEKKEEEVLKLKQLQEEFDAELATTDSNVKTSLLADLDDRLMLRSRGPRLQWDERPFEPLVMQLDETYPPAHTSLVDTTPRPRPAEESIDDLEAFIDFTSALGYPTESVIEMMDNVQHGASELVEEVPALRDPEKGGRLDLNQLRVRNLTPEMIEGLAKAYKEWPFRSPDAAFSNYFRTRASTIPSALKRKW